MSVRKLGDTIILDFTTHNPTTGAVSDADSTPTAEVFEDADDTPLLTPTVTKRTAKTGDYRVPVEATVGNGFAVGGSYNVVVSATVGAVSAKACIASFTLDGKRVNDLNDIAAGAAMTLTVAYDDAKTAAQAGDAMTLTAAYDSAKTAAQEATLTGGITDITFLRRFFTNKKVWDDTNRQWDIYDDAGSSVLYTWKPRKKDHASVTMEDDAFAESDKVA